MTVATLIRISYGYGPGDAPLPRLDFDHVYGLGGENGRRVRGGPDWIRNDRYTIEAVTDQNANARTMSGPMLRRLLEERFQLSAHVETEPASGFALTVAPGGLKVKQVDADACTPVQAQGFRGVPPPDRSAIEFVRRGEQPLCGMRVWTNGPNMLMVGGASALPPSVDILFEILGARVIDRTDIPSTALFNYAVEFAADERTLGPVGGRGRGLTPTSDVPRAPDIFTAFKEQLGLQLEATQAPREYIVIDRIERPSPN